MSDKQKQVSSKEPPEKVPAQEGIVDKVWDIFSSMKTGLVFLGLLTIAAAIGTLIPQETTDPMAAASASTIWKFLGFTDLYGSVWFRVLLGLLCLNLIVCSVQRFDGIFKKSFRPKPPKLPGHVPNKLREEFSGYIDPEKVTNVLHKAGYKVRAEEIEGQWGFVGLKRRWGYWGSLITHLAFVVIAVGALIGSIYGVKGNLSAGSGETIGIRDINLSKGVVKEDFAIRINSAEDRINENGERDNWYTDLSILVDGNEVARGTLSVNHPFSYGGYTFYQSQFAAGAKLEVAAHSTSTTIVMRKEDAYKLPNVDSGKDYFLYMAAMRTEGDQPAVMLQVYEGLDAIQPAQQSTMNLGDTANILDKYQVTFKEMAGYTGLQVKKDPGVWVVWTGFGLGMIGLLLSFYWKPSALYGILVRKEKGEASLLIGTVAGKVADRTVHDFNNVINQLKG